MNDEQMTDLDDFWSDEAFEDTVAAALIACFETKVKKNRGAAPADRLTDERVALMRAAGPYIPSNSRVFLGPASDGDKERWLFDVANDPLPLSGCVAMRPIGASAESRPGAYLLIEHLRLVNSLGKYWHKRRAGRIYETLTMDAGNDGINGERRFFTVTPNGEVWACDQRIPDRLIGGPNVTHSPGETWLLETETYASMALQLLADRRFCWVIKAQEKTARAHLGCMQEEVKSLLYARSLPMTETGRKRPILHLVAAHKRRLKNGTDIDVTQFLRGQQVVEFGGTSFTVCPPATLRASVSAPSRARYFEQVAA